MLRVTLEDLATLEASVANGEGTGVPGYRVQRILYCDGGHPAADGGTKRQRRSGNHAVTHAPGSAAALPTPCKLFAKGECTKGNRCRFDHHDAGAQTAARVAALCGALAGPPGACDVDCVALAPSGWKGVLRNVPADGFLASGAGAASTGSCKVCASDNHVCTCRQGRGDGSVESVEGVRAGAAAGARVESGACVVVVRGKIEAGPILVLVGLKYRGNIGTIFRTAVQSNSFEAIYIIEPEPEPEPQPGSAPSGTGGEATSHAGGDAPRQTPPVASPSAGRAVADADIDARRVRLRLRLNLAEEASMATAHELKRAAERVRTASARARAVAGPPPPAGGASVDVSDKEIAYYSMLNAPLIRTRRFANVAAFIAHASAHGCGRTMVATALADNAVNLYSQTALDLLRQPRVYILMGASRHDAASSCGPRPPRVHKAHDCSCAQRTRVTRVRACVCVCLTAVLHGMLLVVAAVARAAAARACRGRGWRAAAAPSQIGHPRPDSIHVGFHQRRLRLCHGPGSDDAGKDRPTRLHVMPPHAPPSSFV